jgi:hypothetical protein
LLRVWGGGVLGEVEGGERTEDIKVDIQEGFIRAERGWKL